MSSKKSQKRYKGVLGDVEDITRYVKKDLKDIKRSLFGSKKNDEEKDTEEE